MEKTDINNIFNQNQNKRDQIIVFQDKLKRHLSNEYLYIVEKKDDLENQLVHLKMEQSQKNKTLFPNINQKGVRKYFSPLNIQEIEDDHKDEKDRLLIDSIERLKSKISELSIRMTEIKEFLHDIDFILDSDDNKSEKSEDENKIQEEYSGKNNDVVKDSRNGSENKTFPQNVDYSDNIVDYFNRERAIYPQMIRTLYDFSDYLKEIFNQIEVLIEFNDNNIETSEEVNRNLILQLYYNICCTLEEYDISTILIQGEISGKSIKISLYYVCDKEEINSMSVSYEIDYI